jgi:hypothetical protein
MADTEALRSDDIDQGHAQHHGQGQPDILPLGVIATRSGQQGRDVEAVSCNPAPQSELLVGESEMMPAPISRAP